MTCATFTAAIVLVCRPPMIFGSDSGFCRHASVMQTPLPIALQPWGTWMQSPLDARFVHTLFRCVTLFLVSNLTSKPPGGSPFVRHSLGEKLRGHCRCRRLARLELRQDLSQSGVSVLRSRNRASARTPADCGRAQLPGNSRTAIPPPST